MEQSLNRLGASAAGGLQWKRKRSRGVGNTCKKQTWLRAADVTILFVVKQKGGMIEDTGGMSTGIVMEAEGIGVMVAGGESTVLIMMMRTETHITDPDRMHSIAVNMSVMTTGVRNMGILLTGIPMFNRQGMRISTAAETGAVITDTEIVHLTLDILSAIASGFVVLMHLSLVATHILHVGRFELGVHFTHQSEQTFDACQTSVSALVVVVHYFTPQHFIGLYSRCDSRCCSDTSVVPL